MNIFISRRDRGSKPKPPFSEDPCVNNYGDIHFLYIYVGLPKWLHSERHEQNLRKVVKINGNANNASQ